MTETITIVTVEHYGVYKVHTAVINKVEDTAYKFTIAITDCGKMLRFWRPTFVPVDANWDTYDWRTDVTHMVPCAICAELKRIIGGTE